MRESIIVLKSVFIALPDYGIVSLMSGDQTKGFSNGDEKLDRIIEMLRGMTLRVESIETRIDALETRVGERFKDTRPLWEGMQAGFKSLGETVTQMHSDMHDGFRRVEKKIDILNKGLLETKADILDLESRVEKLERKPS